MKTRTKLLKKQFIYLFLLLGVAVSFNSCDDDDDANSFLEKYAGTTWEAVTASPTKSSKSKTVATTSELFLRIVNDPTILVESWEYYGEMVCYEYGKIGEEGSLEVIENSENRLVFEMTFSEDGFEFTVTVTLSVSNDKITIVFESDDFDDSETIILISSDADVDAFEKCLDV